MAYNELIKNISRIRNYIREFYVYGFKSRVEVGNKSARSYDNERRRIESWLADYMSFRQDATGKNVFISVDSRLVPHNPLYKAWKAKSFTKNDITLHFWLLDILSPDEYKTLADIIEIIDRDYLPYFTEADPIDESTLRKKLKEYVALGLIVTQKQGKQLVYTLPKDSIQLASWTDAITFFAEADPLGVIGSFLQDKLDALPAYFCFKHNYFLFAPDSGIMLDLLTAIHEHKQVEIELLNGCNQASKRRTILPLKIFISTQGGRQYVAACNTSAGRPMFFRLDAIMKVKALDVVADFDTYVNRLAAYRAHLWGVSAGRPAHMEHIEMTLEIQGFEKYIVKRLEREKRCGKVNQISDTLWRFTADVYDAQELQPWLRSFTGRIVSLSCSNKAVEARFKSDLAQMAALYGGDDNAL